MERREIFNREFLEVRAKLLQLAASFDRIDRADGAAVDEARMGQIRQGLDVLRRETPDRAEAIQLIFSRPYAENWRHTLGVGVDPAQESAASNGSANDRKTV